jgi:hypothetical protein
LSLTRSLSLGARVAVATAWAACLVVLGLYLLVDGPPRSLAIGAGVWAFSGLASVGAGLFIFMTLVADRLIPSVGRRQSMWTAEMVMFVLFLASGAVALALARYGGS